MVKKVQEQTPSPGLPLILNPAAGRGRARRCSAGIGRILADHDIHFAIVESSAPGDVEEKVRQAALGGATRIVVAGGDGSVHEAVNGLMRAGTNTALGVIPLGTGNDFAKATSMPLDWQRATRLLASRIADNVQERTIDAGKVNSRYFANSVGIGFDAKINEIARRNSFPIGQLNYLLAVFQGMWDGVITPRLRLRFGDSEYHDSVTMVEVCNGATVGGLFRIAPGAINHDGLLDLVFVGPVSRWRILALLPRLLRGTHLSAPEVRHEPVTGLQLDADGPVPCHVDGEMQPACQSFTIDILPGALRLI